MYQDTRLTPHSKALEIVLIPSLLIVDKVLLILIPVCGNPVQQCEGLRTGKTVRFVQADLP
jgi:hypothetical protein